jgi:hypothetical protein
MSTEDENALFQLGRRISSIPRGVYSVARITLVIHVETYRDLDTYMHFFLRAAAEAVSV